MRAGKNGKPTLLRKALACLLSAAMVVAFAPAVAWGSNEDYYGGELVPPNDDYIDQEKPYPPF